MLKNYYIIFIFIILPSNNICHAKPYVCYTSDQDPYLQFGTKTAYEFSAMRQAGKNEQKNIPGCRPLQVWMVIRHGTRNPSGQEIDRFSQITKLRDEIIKNYEEVKNLRANTRDTAIKSKMCAADMNNLQRWNLNWRPEDQDQLTDQGREDMSLLGKRIKTRFFDLLNKPYSEGAYTFRHADTDSTRESAESFSKAMFPGTPVRFALTNENDTLLRSYKNCNKWQELVDENPDTLTQMDRFLSDPRFEAISSNISLRLGFSYNLALEVILYAYDLCRYEKAIKVQQTSVWCSLFTSEELQLIEYAEDLRYYYNSGYGNSINLKMGCTLLKDLMNRFKRLSLGAKEPFGVFYFTHQTSLLTFLSRLNIANDQSPLTANDYVYQTKRQWKTSDISPFGANLMAVFYNCSLSRGGAGSELKVAFYLQEKIVRLQGCDVGLCSWNFIRDRYMQLADDCNIARTCTDGAVNLKISFITIISSLCLLFITKLL